MRTIILTLLSAATLATPALAGVEADLATGRRWADTKTDGERNGVQMDEVQFAARYSILDTGLSVGPSIAYAKFHGNDLGAGTEASNYELGLEAKYGYKVLPWLTPFAKARYVGYSKGTMTLDNADAEATMHFRTEGAHVAIGAAFDVAPLVQITAEAGYGVQMIRTTGGTLDKIYGENGQAIALTDDQKTVEGGNREDFNSKSFLVGVNVALQ